MFSFFIIRIRFICKCKLSKYLLFLLNDIICDLGTFWKHFGNNFEHNFTKKKVDEKIKLVYKKLNNVSHYCKIIA